MVRGDLLHSHSTLPLKFLLTSHLRLRVVNKNGLNCCNSHLGSTGGATIETLAGTPDALAPGVFTCLSQYRHRVFVEKLGWQLTCKNAMEFDQFDRPDTLYVIARREDGALVGVARLLPTNKPYLLADVFPQLMQGMPLPNAADIWELSRFAAVDLDPAAPCIDSDALLQFSSIAAVDLLREVLCLAEKHGVRRLITVSPLGVERLLRRAGFVAHRAAPPVVVDGRLLFACWIEVQPSSRSH